MYGANPLAAATHTIRELIVFKSLYILSQSKRNNDVHCTVCSLSSETKLDTLKLTGWCESHLTVLFLSSVKAEMTDTIEIGLKILPQNLRNQKYIVLDNISFIKNYLQL